VLIRDYEFDRGWDNFNVLASEFQYLKRDNSDQAFIRSLSYCRIFVVDHLSTTWLESLSLNKPTIMFWSDIYDIDANILPHFNKLREVGVLHDTPELAAKKINEVYDWAEDWWFQIDRQKAIKEFCDVFVYMPENPLKEWRIELKRISAGLLKCL